MNYNPSSVNDRLQPPGTKSLKRSMEMFDDRFKFRDLVLAPHFRQFSSDKIDNHRPGQVIFAHRIKDLVNRRNFPARARFHSFTHINGRRERRGVILPMTAAQGVRLCFKSLKTLSSLASATHKSNPPLVCASVKRIRCDSSVFSQSTSTVVATRFSRLPPGPQPFSIKSAISQDRR